MKHIIATAVALGVFAAAPASAESTQISSNGSQPSAKGAAQYFTGSVIVDPLYAANDSTSSTGGLVTFEPGARSAWHMHPGGQYLIVTSGSAPSAPPSEVKMRLVAATLASLCLIASLGTQAERATASTKRDIVTQSDVGMVSPALERYTRDRVLGEAWKRPGLTPRDRSIIKLAALIARNQTIALSEHLKLALDHGVKPAEISEIITHLAFYSGWANAISAIAITKDVFAQRNIGPEQLPAGSPALPPLNEAAEADRAKRVGDQFGAIFPGVVQYTTDVLFRDLWLRPDLAPRDRSLVTISALIANGQVAQLSGHIPIGMNNGLTQPEIAEAITHLAFYVGWPNVFSAMPVAKEVFEKRPR
jgi:4-carboxymuconolactone decarboxylase